MKYTLPMLVVWSLYLLAYWPGVLGPDTFDQWRQLMAFQFTNWHPVTHTLYLWLLTRLSPSPASVAIFQILAFSTIISYGLAVFERKGVPPIVLWVVAALMAMAPINGLMVINLWKDVPYAFSLLWITILLVVIIDQQGAWLASIKSSMLLGFVLVLPSLFRLNGILVTVSVLALLFLYYRQYYRRLALSLGVVILVLFFVRVPLPKLVPVAGEQSLGVMLVHPVSAYVAQNRLDPLREYERNVLNEIHSLADGWKMYDCYHIDPIQWDPQTNMSVANGSPVLMAKMLARLVLYDPSIFIRHSLCNTSYLWNISYPRGSYLELVYIPTEEYYRGFQPYQTYQEMLKPSPVSPQLNTLLTYLYRQSTNSLVKMSLWRPALYMYLFLAVCALAVVWICKRYWLLIVPLLANTVVLLAISPSSMIRYQYSAYLLALLFCLPLLALVIKQAWKMKTWERSTAANVTVGSSTISDRNHE